MRKIYKSIVIVFFILTFNVYVIPALARPLLDQFEKNNPHSTLVIDHHLFQKFIDKYVYEDESGVNLIRYSKVINEDKKNLDQYIKYLTAIDINNYNRAEQLSYWVNLYNSLVIHTVLNSYPVKSILDIETGSTFYSRLFRPGPWNAKFVKVNNIPLSLDDIEIRIVRSIWKDARIHYALSCASYGCPNLQKQVYTGKNVDSLFDKAAKEYVNNFRGVTIEGDKLIVSKIYTWYQAEFGGSELAVIAHLKQYAEPDLKQKLNRFSSISEYRYDWSLNDG